MFVRTRIAAALLALALPALGQTDPGLTLPDAPPPGLDLPALPGAPAPSHAKKKKARKEKAAPPALPGLDLPGATAPATAQPPPPGLGLDLPPLPAPAPKSGTAAKPLPSNGLDLPGLDLPPATVAKPPPAPSPSPSDKKAAPRLTYQIGIYRLEHPGQPDDPAFEDIERVMRSIAEVAPKVRNPIFMPRTPKACELEDDKCFAALGGFQQLDQILLGSLVKADNGMSVRVRLIDVGTGKRVGQAQQIVASTDKVELKAWAESLACQLLIPTGCEGTAVIDADLPEMQLLVDNKPLARNGTPGKPERVKLPVGVHKVRVVIGQRTSLERPLPVLREGGTQVALYAREFDEGGISLLAAADLPTGMDGHREAPASVRPKVSTGRGWTKPVGISVAALGLVSGGLGIWQGSRTKSFTQQANDSYVKNGNLYEQKDLATIDSARSSAQNANILLTAGLLLVGAGLGVAFAF